MFSSMTYEEVCIEQKRTRRERMSRSPTPPENNYFYQQKNTTKPFQGHQQQHQSKPHKWHRRTRRGGRGRARRGQQHAQYQSQQQQVPFQNYFYGETSNLDPTTCYQPQHYHLVFIHETEHDLPVALLPSGQKVQVLPTAHNLDGAALLYAPPPKPAARVDVNDDHTPSAFAQRALEEAQKILLQDDDDRSSVTSGSEVSLRSLEEIDIDDDEQVSLASDHLFDFLEEEEDDDQ